MKTALRSSLLTAAFFASGFAAHAVTITESASAPGSSVVAQPDSSGPAFNGSQDFTDNAGPPAQSFTAPSSFVLGSITTKGFANTAASFGNGVQTGTLTITISQVTGGIGGTVANLDQETGSAAAITDGSAYLTFALTTPVALVSGTQYAYSIYSSTGYYGFAKSAADVYAGGFAFQQGGTSRSALTGATVTNVQADDRTFFAGAAVPEPATAILALGSAAAMLGRRRRAVVAG